MPAIHISYVFQNITIPEDWTTARKIRSWIPIGKENKVPLDHDAIIAINAAGITKYYEYGRYEKGSEYGVLRNVPLETNLTMVNGYPTRQSLATLIKEIKTIFAEEVKRCLVHFEYYHSADYDKIKAYVQNREAHKRKYVLLSNDCITFARDAIRASEHHEWVPKAISDDGEIGLTWGQQ